MKGVGAASDSAVARFAGSASPCTISSAPSGVLQGERLTQCGFFSGMRSRVTRRRFPASPHPRQMSHRRGLRPTVVATERDATIGMCWEPMRVGFDPGSPKPKLPWTRGMRGPSAVHAPSPNRGPRRGPEDLDQVLWEGLEVDLIGEVRDIKSDDPRSDDACGDGERDVPVAVSLKRVEEERLLDSPLLRTLRSACMIGRPDVHAR